MGRTYPPEHANAAVTITIRGDLFNEVTYRKIRIISDVDHSVYISILYSATR